MTAEYLESPLLRAAGFRHAFFTRRGGVSEAAYASLNFSVSVGDDPARVARNFELAAQVLGVSSQTMFFLSQVHGAGVHVLEAGEAASPGARERVMTVEGDALLSRVPSLACTVRTADCVPILVGETRTGAVAAIHAGWRGVVRGVIEAGVGRLIELAGGRAELVAAVGPHIGAEAFEVGDDVAAELENASGAVGVVDRSRVRPRVDLSKIVREKLRLLGITLECIDSVPGCTFSEPGRFFSFRRDGRASGRLLSAILPRVPGAPR